MFWMLLTTAIAGTPLVLPGAGVTPPFVGDDPGGAWMALLDEGGTWRLRPVNVQVVHERETWEGESWDYARVATDPELPAALLLRQIDGLTPGPVPTTATYTELGPGARLELMGGATLLASGAELEWSSEPGFCPYPYQVVIDGSGTRQTLFAGCSWSGEGSVQWAGDLDRDGKADLALWMPGEYTGELQLWMSGAAAPGQVVGRVATWVEEPGC